MNPEEQGLTSIGKYAKHRGVSYQAIDYAIKRGWFPRSLVHTADGRKWFGDIFLADQEYDSRADRTHVEKRVLENIDAARGGQEAAGSPEQLSPRAAAELRQIIAKADREELKAQHEAGDLVEIREVEREWADLLSSVRTRLLAIPTYLGQALPPPVDMKVLAIVERQIRDALEELVRAEEREEE